MVAQNFPKSMATALGQYMPQYHLKKNSLRLKGGILPKMGDFANFQCSISPLSFMIELRISLLTYRKSYLVYPRNIFSMTLTFSIKVK